MDQSIAVHSNGRKPVTFRISMVKADFDVALTEAEGLHSIAIEKCGSLKDVDKKACLSTADATLASDQANATAERDSALVDAAHHE